MTTKKSNSSASLSYTKPDFRKSKSCSSLKSPSSIRAPTTPDGKKRCHTCDQFFFAKKASCPHCKAQDSVPLSDLETNLGLTDNDGWTAFEKEVKSLRQRQTPEARAELVSILFSRAMASRYQQPKRSYQLFNEVIAVDPNHWESRIKVSWLEIRFNNFLPIVPLLEPLINSSLSTVEQKQRAYNNMVCSYLFRFPADMETAEKIAKKGIDLEPRGNPKLWENYGTALKQQGRISDAREAYSNALSIDPKSEFAKANVAALTKMEKKNKKRKSSKGGDSMMTNKENKENGKATTKATNKGVKKLLQFDRM